MEQPKRGEFVEAKEKTLPMMTAVKLARAEIRAVSDAPVDSVARCERIPGDGWLVALDLIESPARLGENDLLARYELRLDPEGVVTGIERMGRARREESDLP